MTNKHIWNSSIIGTMLLTVALFVTLLLAPSSVVAWSPSVPPTNSQHTITCGPHWEDEEQAPPEQNLQHDNCSGNNNTSRRRDILKGMAAASFGLMVGGSSGATATGVASAAVLDPSSSSSSLSSPQRRSSSKIYHPAPSSLSGKVMLITGGTSGLGLESAQRLSAAGATVVITARTQAKGERALGSISQYLSDQSMDNPGKVYALELDLNDLESVRSFPQRYRALSLSPIDVLMNNAGVAAIPQREVTKDGFERTFQTNHLAPFILTSLLFAYLRRDGDGCRVINVSSYAHEFATMANSNMRGLDLDNLNGEIDYSGLGWPAYCRSKLENILFTNELQRRADAAGLDWLTAISLHPGRVATDIWRTTYFGTDQRGGNGKGDGDNAKSGGIQSIVSDLFYDSILTVEEGGSTQVMLAARGEPEGSPVKGEYYDYNMRIKKKMNAFAMDEDAARRLWEKSEQLAGIKFRLE